MIKRCFDLLISSIALVMLSFLFLVLAIAVKLSGPGPVFYLQWRVGISGKEFTIFKFRTMHVNSEKGGLLTVGGRDKRITAIGYFLRKFKLDELPQLFNVIKGDMSLVGPRPEVKKYVDLYNSRQREVLSVRPGITDYASLIYSNENDLLAKASDPEREYINTIMPDKLELNLKYIRERNLFVDIKILTQTLVKILVSNQDNRVIH